MRHFDHFFNNSKSTTSTEQIMNNENSKADIKYDSTEKSEQVSDLSDNITAQSPLKVRMSRNMTLIWLDTNTNQINTDDWRNTAAQLRGLVNTINTFNDRDECIDFLTDFGDRKAVMVISGALCRNILPLIQDIPQLDIIFIICKTKSKHEQWAKEWPKIKGIFTEVASICESLKQTAYQYEQNTISMGFITSDDIFSKKLDQLDCTFMYTQILKEILLTIKFEQKHIKEFTNYCREQFAENESTLMHIKELESKYHNKTPVWWYTNEFLLYSILNCALRTMDVDIIIKMGFFLGDLCRHIARLHLEQSSKYHTSFTVYRGQGVSKAAFAQMTKTKGGLMAFNNFLSTSKDRDVSFAFAESNQDNPDLVGVLFVMIIDPSKSTTPFASLSGLSYFEDEDEVLFSMHTVFRIGDIKPMSQTHRFFQVDLTLTSDTDNDLCVLTNRIREEIPPNVEGWERLGSLLLTLGQTDKAQQVYHVLLEQSTNENKNAPLYNQLGKVRLNQGNYKESIKFFEKSLAIQQQSLPPNHPDLAISYNNIGNVHYSMDEHSKALLSYEKAHAIRQKSLPTNHPDLAISYNNIGNVYDSMGEYSKALLSYEKALTILQQSLPPNHPDLAISFNNIGAVHSSMGEYSKALLSHEKALGIRQQSLPTNHPDLAQSYNNIGAVHTNMGEYSKAVLYYEKALAIQQQSLPTNHPHLATSYNNIGNVCSNMGEYSKALLSFQKALAIQQQSLPTNHPHLATSYNNIGNVCSNMGEYSKALLSFQKALAIQQQSLPTNHPHLATSYNNIGNVCSNMGEYSKALLYHEKALGIRQQSLATNHPDLASSYNNIGNVYYNMREHSKALLSHETALAIRQQSLPTNHPDLSISYNNIGNVYESMGEYSKALLSHEKALGIRQQSLPTNHPDLAESFNNIGNVHHITGDYLKARLFYERAINIAQLSLPLNHPSLKVYRKNLEIVKKKL